MSQIKAYSCQNGLQVETCPTGLNSNARNTFYISIKKKKPKKIKYIFSFSWPLCWVLFWSIRCTPNTKDWGFIKTKRAKNIKWFVHCVLKISSGKNHSTTLTARTGFDTFPSAIRESIAMQIFFTHEVNKLCMCVKLRTSTSLMLKMP